MEEGEPQNYMFAEMRAALNIPKSIDILDHIYALPTSEQGAAMESIRAIERRAMIVQAPQPGLLQLMDYLDSRGIPKGICTRNFDTPVTHLLETFLPNHTFLPIITRDFRPPKPDPAGILHIASSWGLAPSPQEAAASETLELPIIMVGDSIDDMTAGRRAGAATVLLVNPANEHLADHEHTDLCISRLDKLIQIVEDGFVGEQT
ncbi:HAD-like protein [Rhizodiscina lignyota]|uniref:HAD-like protein n=1 Tax=Rhizodiscina lignyota TaxID=1504668 RepID=A0A9P4IHP6_9PEZI|nr:HAD-like protein [Rhizodiscina lignyota]